MANLNVVILGASDYGKEIGKKGTTSDLTFYNLKKGENTVTFIEPNRFPERIAPLFYAVSMAHKALLIVDQINPAFGEEVIMLDSIGLKEGIVILKNYLSREQIAPLIKGTVVDGYEFLEDDKNLLREKFLEDASKVSSPQNAETGTLPVDHFFNVRGIGTVVLGSLAEGSIKKHDVLTVLPGKKTAQVRSIQKHDEDFDSAGVGERTGIALKGVEIEDLDRGTILTNDKSIKQVSSLESKAFIVKYWPAPLKEGMVLHIGHWMQYVPARVEAVSKEGDWHKPELKLKLDKMLVFRPGARAVLTYPEGGKLRVVGTIVLL
ncbi:MAG: EF-Tu/IF-2/RF-3 family GTPase [Methanothrix sp.]|jgi:selenocysteine-specific translation elongation factor|nr:EF-Tu/IF-2/RF-3 family GTPase [Methanothrix sp.]